MSSSSPPSAAELASECGRLPEGWIVNWSATRQRRYYYRSAAGERGERTQWHMPTEEEEAARDVRRAERKEKGTQERKHSEHSSKSSSRRRREHSRSRSRSRSSRSRSRSRAREHDRRRRRSRTRSRSRDRSRRRHRSRSRSHRRSRSPERKDGRRSEREGTRHNSSSSSSRPSQRQEDRDDDWGNEEQPRKRRTGLGFDGAASNGGPSRSHMNFVSSGGAPANTPASSSAAAAVSASVAAAAAAPAFHRDRSSRWSALPPRRGGGGGGGGGRIESASRPGPSDVEDPPVFPSSLEALSVLDRQGGFKKSQWSDPRKYMAQLVSTKVITVNNVYGSATEHAQGILKLLGGEEALPPPPQRTFEEEPPALILARRDAFNELDAYLTRLVQDAGLREQPSMCFLRWGFNQRSLQSPALSYEQADPLLPMNASSSDECMLMELLREGLSHKNSNEICAKLAEKCKEKAQKLVQLRRTLMGADAVATELRPFTLLYPHEAHLYTDAPSSSPTNNNAHSHFRSRDRVAHNQSAREQYWIMYDRGGKEEYAIPLNHARFTQLQRDYERTTGTIGGQGAGSEMPASSAAGSSAASSSADESRVKSDQVFLRRLWSMCARYDTISGAGYQAALPEEGFDMLAKYWGVEHECYASPLNHCMDSFGSAFIDTDRFFGSKGSFLDQRPLSGGFEANPPFLEEVMAPMAFHLLGLLERAARADSPLCFVCLWPGWDDCVAYDLLMTSRFMRKLVVFEKGDHAYKEGLQHRCTSQPYRRSKARTFVFWMQTDAAAAKWPTTDDTIQHFKQAFMRHRG